MGFPQGRRGVSRRHGEHGGGGWEMNAAKGRWVFSMASGTHALRGKAQGVIGRRWGSHASVLHGRDARAPFFTNTRPHFNLPILPRNVADQRISTTFKPQRRAALACLASPVTNSEALHCLAVAICSKSRVRHPVETVAPGIMRIVSKNRRPQSKSPSFGSVPRKENRTPFQGMKQVEEG